MALPSTLLRFEVKLSDVARNTYETLDLRVAMHPSEGAPFLLTRILAYALNFQEGISFTQGIGSPDDPALQVKDLTGSIRVWIDVGNPSAKRLHKASKTAKSVRVYTYRDPSILLQEALGNEIYRKEQIEVFALAPKFLKELGETLQRENKWEMLHDQGEISVTVKDKTYHVELTQHSLR